MNEQRERALDDASKRLAERNALFPRLTTALAATSESREICEVTTAHLRGPRLGVDRAAVLLVDPASGARQTRAGDLDVDSCEDVLSSALFDGERVIGELRIGRHGRFDGEDQKLLDAVARLVDMSLSRSRLASLAAGASSSWIEAVSGASGRRPVQPAELPPDRLSALYFGEPSTRRATQWAGIAALVLHFALFTVVFPDFSRDLPDLARELVVIRRYTPPIPEKVERRQVKRTATRVPIPDPTPAELEPIVPDVEEELPELPVDTVFLADLPISSPLPAEYLDALDIDTADLQPPRVTRRVQPHYDRERARRGIQGSADVQILVDTEGRVTFARVLNSSGDEELDRLALEAVQQWEFVPAVLRGSLVAVRAVVTINFRIY